MNEPFFVLTRYKELDEVTEYKGEKKKTLKKKLENHGKSMTKC